MKSSADLKETCYPSAKRDASFRRLGDAAENLKKRALAGTVAADDTENFSFAELRSLRP